MRSADEAQTGTNRPRSTRKWTWWRISKWTAGVFCLLLALFIAFNFRIPPGPNSPVVRVSPETTWITSPLKPNGDVDYVAWYNQKFGDIRPEDNAAIELLKARLLWRPPGSELANVYAALDLATSVSATPAELDLWKWLQANTSENAPLCETALLDFNAYNRAEAYHSVPFSNDSNPAVAEWLVQVSPILDALHLASRKNRMHLPVSDGLSIDTLRIVDFVIFVRDGRHALQVSAMRHLGEANAELACEDASVLLQTAGLKPFGETKLNLSLQLTFFKQTFAVLRQVMFSGKASDRVLAETESRLRTANLPSFTHAVCEVERAVVLEALASMARCGTSSVPENTELQESTLFERMKAASVDWELAFRKFNQYADRIEELVDEPNPNVMEAAVRQLRAEVRVERTAAQTLLKRLSSRTDRAELVFETVAASFSDGLPNMIRKCQAVRSERDVLLAGIAVQRFRLKHGRLPVNLEELVPEFCDEVPVDLWAEAPLIYRIEGDRFQVYSVGPNRKDDGGVTDEDSMGVFDDQVAVPRILTMEDWVKEHGRKQGS